jgi:hypothetical protein
MACVLTRWSSSSTSPTHGPPLRNGEAACSSARLMFTIPRKAQTHAASACTVSNPHAQHTISAGSFKLSLKLPLQPRWHRSN